VDAADWLGGDLGVAFGELQLHLEPVQVGHLKMLHLPLRSFWPKPQPVAAQCAPAPPPLDLRIASEVTSASSRAAPIR
jgi:hypothetical protein